MKQQNLQIEEGKTKVEILNGSLRSFKWKKQEWIHNPDTSPGWGKSDDEMFPVIGATKSNDYQLSIGSENAHLDQHGILRAIAWQLVESDEKSAVFEKKYAAKTDIENPKYPIQSPLEVLNWPFSFLVRKYFLLSEKKLSMRFEIEAPADMPFQMGFHPAFNIVNSEVYLVCSDQKHSLENVIKAGQSAYPLLNCNEVVLHDGRKRTLQIHTEGFGHLMCWTEVKNMLCIEPITHYPAQFDLKTFQKEAFKIPENGKRIFNVHLSIIM